MAELRAGVLAVVGAIAVFALLAAAALLFEARMVYPEAATIGEDSRSFRDLEERFQELARRKGAPYAYEVLRRASLPPGTDLHLLGHVVGDELYKQEGLGGIALCTQEFRNACSHTIVIGALSEYGGEIALPKIREACERAPGGEGAYTMCYHGLGHGVFAFFNYDLPKAVEFCAKTGTAQYRDREYTECVGGAVMELMGGGGHDRERWLASREKYLSSSNPLAPCDAPWLPDKTRVMCYVYLTPRLFEFAGASLARPQEEHFTAAFSFCDRIPASQPANRDACFGGIGKEFPVLAMRRDVRDMSKATDEQLQTMRQWCALAPHEEARLSCERSMLESLFWGGENPPDVSIRYCALARESDAAFCFGKIIAMGKAYLREGGAAHSRLCNALPGAFGNQCRKSSGTVL